MSRLPRSAAATGHRASTRTRTPPDRTRTRSPSPGAAQADRRPSPRHPPPGGRRRLLHRHPHQVSTLTKALGGARPSRRPLRALRDGRGRPGRIGRRDQAQGSLRRHRPPRALLTPTPNEEDDHAPDRDPRPPPGSGTCRASPMPSTSISVEVPSGPERLVRRSGCWWRTLGWVLLLVGLAAIPLPEPGLLITFAGPALLSRQYAWTQRRVDTVRMRALQGAAQGVASWPSSCRIHCGSRRVMAASVAWMVSPPAPGWWPISN